MTDHADQPGAPAPPDDKLARDLAASQELVRQLEAELATLRPLATNLREELRAVRAGMGQTAEIGASEWPATNGSHPDSFSSGPAPPPPLPRPVLVPRLILETAFLVAAAAISALAELDAVEIVIVMTVAWLIVALAEWAAFARQRSWRLDEVAPAIPEGGSPSWYVPPVEQTIIRGPDAAESHTIVTSLPAEETGVRPAVSLEDTDIRPAPKRRRWRRDKEETAGDGDPWEV